MNIVSSNVVVLNIFTPSGLSTPFQYKSAGSTDVRGGIQYETKVLRF